MEKYFVEGLFLTRRNLNKSKKAGEVVQLDIELFSKSFWANSKVEAIRMATEALDGGQWVKEPKVSEISEEKRMRTLGAPELPGFSRLKKKRKTRKSQD
jgi:hypothetical protein